MTKTPKEKGVEPYIKGRHTLLRVYAQSGQYHTIVDSPVRLTWYLSHALKLSHANRWVNPQMSNKRLQEKRSQASSKA